MDVDIVPNSLFAIELIDLGVSNPIMQDSSPSSSDDYNKLYLTLDPKYNDTVYCHHVSGVHQICIENALRRLKNGGGSGEGETSSLSQVKWLINTNLMESV